MTVYGSLKREDPYFYGSYTGVFEPCPSCKFLPGKSYKKMKKSKAKKFATAGGEAHKFGYWMLKLKEKFYPEGYDSRPPR